MESEAKASSFEGPLTVPRESLPEFWDAELVGKRLVQAFATLDRLPRMRGPREPGGHWPRTVTEWADQLAQAELAESERRARQEVANRTVIRPTALEIQRMDTALEWLRELRDLDTGMALVTTLWALRSARGRSIKKLCIEKQWAPHTFFRKRAKALASLADMLNARGRPVF
ncbi:hypothetical protein QEV83_04810 [Methylocapsa sp. D3K7]|uniref:hypothetical protein n=1 Tax=Methylocapsa sp. D3K7 TaxID=3041435 RepID=UPI00244EEC7B|nr:hypothetical protein [Methylocapsa sp. D3K7]WGJ15593.1 hypothetical protein QEV83_04810 [Methylocapsa sp. D3K7]